MKNKLVKQIDWLQTLLPLISIALLVIVFLLYPQKSTQVLHVIRSELGNKFGWLYILLGISMFTTTLVVAFSKCGQIVLGSKKAPIYGNVKWGMMIFTSTMSADIIFYALTEWTMYAREQFIQEKVGGVGLWTLTYSLFHWGPIAWSFYIILAVAFAFMIHVRKKDKQKFSEAVRPLLGNKVDGVWGKLINLIAIFALIAGTATTFSVSMPLLSAALSKVFGFNDSSFLCFVLSYICLYLQYKSTQSRLNTLKLSSKVFLFFFL